MNQLLGLGASQPTSSMSAIEIGQLRRQATLDFVYRVGATTPMIIQLLFNFQNHRHYSFIGQLEQQRLLKRVSAPTIRSGYLLILTPTGRSKLQLYYPEILLPSKRINHQQVRHDLAAQIPVATLLQRRAITGFLTEKRAGKPDRLGEKRPDVIVFGEEIHAIEIELTPKRPVALHRAVLSLAHGIREQRFSEVQMYSHSEAVLRPYREILNAGVIPTYKLSQPHDKWTLAGKEDIRDVAPHFILKVSEVIKNAFF